MLMMRLVKTLGLNTAKNLVGEGTVP